MNLLIKIFFKIKLRFQIHADKNRLQYFKFIYGDKISLGNDIAFGEGGSIVFYPEGGNPLLMVGSDNSFRKFCILSISKSGQFAIGANNFFNNNCSFNCMGSMQTGDNNLFGENICVYDHNHRFSDRNQLVRDQGFSVGSVTIGNNCWIGSSCIILNNVTIGDNVVIGANNLIYKSVPSDTIIKSSASYQAIDRL